MERAKKGTIEIPISEAGFETAHSFIGNSLKRNKVTRQIIAETMLMFEALFQKLREQGYDPETMLTIQVKNSFGEITIKMGFEAKPFRLTGEDPGAFSPEDRILNAYTDKIDLSYHSGYNLIRIVVKRSYHLSMLFCAAGIVLAILVYIPILLKTNELQRMILEQGYVFPVIKLFSNAMLLVGAPVTFFSLLKNLTDTYIISERSFSGRKLQLKTVITSFISVLLAIGMSLVIVFFTTNRAGYLEQLGYYSEFPTLSALLDSLIPDNLTKLFETISPFPLIIAALLVTYALCSAGKYFDSIKKAIDACYTLFSRMLHIIMFTLPLFCFATVLYLMLMGGFKELLTIAEMILAILISMVSMLVFYLIRLLAGGVKIGPFVKNLLPLLRENFKISSSIDAVPFNIRYCARNYGMNRKQLSQKLPVLAQINLDGNSYLIMMIAALFIFMLNKNVSLFSILVIAILVVFLSYGAPNQPGSILIGILIIMLYLRTESMIPVAILAEVAFGWLQNLINVAGDIVTVAIEEKKERTHYG